MFVLAVNCQRDESADIDADRGLPSTEVSPRQLQDRAREIVSSEEYENVINQLELFFSKIHSGEKFYTEDIFDLENDTYNYDVINERLPMTSFKSAEEFVKGYETAFYSIQKLTIKYPELINQSSFQLSSLENAIRKIERKDPAWKCDQERDYCEKKVVRKALTAALACGFVGTVAFPWTGPIAGGTCLFLAWIDYESGIYDCKSDYRHCVNR